MRRHLVNLLLATLSGGISVEAHGLGLQAPNATVGKENSDTRTVRSTGKPSRIPRASSSTKSGSPGPERPLQIFAQQMEILTDSTKVIWRGSVRAERDDLFLSCDTATAEYDQGKRIKTLTCNGSVHLLQRPRRPSAPEREAWGELAVFERDRDVIVLTGTPRAREGKNTLMGSKVTFFVNEERLLVDNVHVVMESAESESARKTLLPQASTDPSPQNTPDGSTPR